MCLHYNSPQRFMWQSYLCVSGSAFAELDMPVARFFLNIEFGTFWMLSFGNNFDEFPENQLTEFCTVKEKRQYHKTFCRRL